MGQAVSTYKIIIPREDESSEIKWLVGNGIKVPSIWSAPPGWTTLWAETATKEADVLIMMRYPDPSDY